MIERWLNAVRDHPGRPDAKECHALTRLAQRLNWTTGAGYASIAQVCADADVGKATVMRATGWARKAGFLVQTRRGHRISAETVIASEWQLTMPPDNRSQGLTGEPLAQTQGLTGEPLGSAQGLNGSDPRSQKHPPKVSPQTHHQESVSIKNLSASLSQPSSLEDILAAAVPGADEREIEWAITGIQQKEFYGEIRSARAYLRAVISRGDAAGIIEDARGEMARLAMSPDPFGPDKDPQTAGLAGGRKPNNGECFLCYSGDHSGCTSASCICGCRPCPPCPECGGSFGNPELEADPGFQAMVRAGEAICSHCHDRAVAARPRRKELPPGRGVHPRDEWKINRS